MRFGTLYNKFVSFIKLFQVHRQALYHKLKTKKKQKKQIKIFHNTQGLGTELIFM